MDGVVVKSTLIFSTFLGRCGFKVDRRWGGLVRLLDPTETDSGEAGVISVEGKPRA